ncbi:MAG: PEP-CTERM sorting domain-containing protein [Chitinispirillaceae bacterium]|nr:PEP-CTERM sorting domain-containing protein [Chitinispirillaceae bacterium]
MKKNIVTYLTAVSTIFMLSTAAQAEIIKLKEVGVDPYAVVNISGVINHSSVLAGQYKLEAEDGTIMDAFCVDPTWSIPDQVDYELFDVSGKYLQAAWLWENMDNLGSDVVATQIAIWEVTWEGENAGFDLKAGDFRLNSVNKVKNSTSEVRALNMLSELASVDLSSFNADGYRVVKSTKTQDYLIRHSVPEPSSMLMLLIGFACLAGYRKKRK